MEVLVVFNEAGGHWLDRFLRPGFKHCFIVLRSGEYWLIVDGREGIPDVEVVCGTSYDLATFYREKGYTVVETRQRQRVPYTPFLPANCVGLCKGLLAIGAPLVLTPWQLYRHLTSKGLQVLPGFSKPKPPKPPEPPPPPAPAPPPPTPEADDETLRAASRKKTARIKRRSGRISTILTGPGSDQTLG